MIFFMKHGRGFLILGIPLFLVSCGGCSLSFGGNARPGELILMTYNVQNLFDGVVDGTEYPEFLPGEGEWSDELFHLKMLQLSEVINMHPSGGPDILLLQEVENSNALEVLTTHYLKGTGYAYTVISEAEGTAVNNAVLSRFPIVGVKVHSVSVEGVEGGRPILECRIDAGGLELTVLNCHWKSKNGGAEATEILRRAAASAVARRLLQLHAEDAGLPVVVAGDLNENADEWERVDGAYPTALRMVADPTVLPASSEGVLFLSGTFFQGEVEPEENPGVLLFSPWAAYSDFPGSYAYRGEWETIDHFLLSSALADGKGLEYGGFEVVNSDFLLNDGGYPLRWIAAKGTGYSDHLPLLLSLAIVEE